MLAIVATDALSLIDPPTLKRAPNKVPTTLHFETKPTTVAWSQDNSRLCVSSNNSLLHFNLATNSFQPIYSAQDAGCIQNLVVYDDTTAYFSMGEIISVFDTVASQVSQVLDTHKAGITSISLSNDGTLLASTSLSAVHIHNLTLGNHSVLRGLNLAGRPVTVCSFHPHSRTRLLLGIGKQLVVYDTTKPSGPLRTIQMHESMATDIHAIACSPFSKTLVAVASPGGHVGLIDLDKDKGLFRTLNLKVPVTSILFSPEGAAIYVGTETGKLLILDLRTLDKPPKCIVISESGQRIEGMAVQKKSKSTEATPKPPSTTSGTRTPAEASNANRRPAAQATKMGPLVIASPARPRAQRISSEPSPQRRLPSKLKDQVAVGTPAPKTRNATGPKSVLSPARDPLGNSASVGDISVQLETLGALRTVQTQRTPSKGKGKETTSPVPPRAPRVSSSPRITKAATETVPNVSKVSRTATTTTMTSKEPLRRTRTLPSTTQPRKGLTTQPESVASAPATRAARLTVPTEVVSGARKRAGSSASRVGAETISTLSTQPSQGQNGGGGGEERAGSSASRRSSPSLIGEGLSPPARFAVMSRTPSPELPGVEIAPITPITKGKEKSREGMDVLGLGSPEVDRWIKAGEGKDLPKERVARNGGKKTVGFKDSESSDDDEGEEEERENGEGRAGEDRPVNGIKLQRERNMAVQISPRRSGLGGQPTTSWAPSPLRHAVPGSPSVGIGGGAHELLRNIVQDVMYDFQAESKAEMMGLHLDLVRMGRGWKRELRELMDEYVGDLKDLREENRQLREENERLRRGY